MEVLKLLRDDGADVAYHDPFVPAFEENGLSMESVALTDEAVQASDLVIVLCDHTGIDYSWLSETANHVLDTRNALKGVNRRDNITLL